MFVLRLGEPNTFVANMLQAEPNSILAAATRVKQEIERQTRLASDRMPVAKLLDLTRGPRVVAVNRIFDLFHAECRILWREIWLVFASPRE